jgi:phospholipid/cholesterol/gamma-HCH transport system permease protein
MRVLATTGFWVRQRWKDSRYVTAVVATILFLSVRPRYWPRTVRKIFSVQILFMGAESVIFVILIGALLGVIVARELQDIPFGADLLNVLMSSLVARELAPLFANLVVLTKYGSVIATELGNMKATGEVRLLESQGIEPLTYLAMPRIIGMAVSVLGLTALFTLVAFIGAFYYSAVLGHAHLTWPLFLDGIFRTLELPQLVVIGLKSILPALFQGAICVTQGLSVERLPQVPLATKRAMNRSLAALFLISAAISLVAPG